MQSQAQAATTAKAPAQPLQMTRAEWAATPRDFKISKRDGRRFVMRHHPSGIALYPVRIKG